MEACPAPFPRIPITIDEEWGEGCIGGKFGGEEQSALRNWVRERGNDISGKSKIKIRGLVKLSEKKM